MFENLILPVVIRHANRVLKDEERVAIAIVLAWYTWANREQDFPPSVYAQVAVRRVLRGDDLPGIRDNSAMRGDPYRSLANWGGGGLTGLSDRKPGPERQAIAREQLDRLMVKLNDRQTKMVLLVEAGLTSTHDLSTELGISPGRVSQMRREILEKLTDE